MNYITLEQAIELHDALVEQFGGLKGIRDNHLLESALATPMTTLFQKDKISQYLRSFCLDQEKSTL